MECSRTAFTTTTSQASLTENQSTQGLSGETVKNQEPQALYLPAQMSPPTDAAITRKVQLFDSVIPGEVFPDPGKISQHEASQWLCHVRKTHGLSNAFRALFELNIHTGHIAGWDSALKHFAFPQPDKPYCFRAMINFRRSGYSRNYMNPMENPPKGALCKICRQHVADANNPANARLRAMDLPLGENHYFVHPSQYPYGQGHLILIQYEHQPMHHDYSSLKDHMLLLDQAPEYAVCQNSHIRGGGATLPQHHHVPLMHKAELPIMDVQIKPGTESSKDGVNYSMLDYPFTSFCLTSADGDKLALATEAIINDWKAGGGQEGQEESTEMKRTANYILCKEGERYKIFIFLRDVSCLAGKEFQKIKSEYCGFIELAGKLLLAEKPDPAENQEMKRLLNIKSRMVQIIEQGLRELDPQQKTGDIGGQARLEAMLSQ